MVWDEDEVMFKPFYRGNKEDEQKIKAAKTLSGSKLGWQHILLLRFMLVDMPHVLGWWQLETKGKASSIKNIVNSFDFVLTNAGTVIGVPFDLSVVLHSSDTQERRKYPVLSLTPNLGREALVKLSEVAGLIQNAGLTLLSDSYIKEFNPKLLRA